MYNAREVMVLFACLLELISQFHSNSIEFALQQKHSSPPPDRAKMGALKTIRSLTPMLTKTTTKKNNPTRLPQSAVEAGWWDNVRGVEATSYPVTKLAQIGIQANSTIGQFDHSNYWTGCSSIWQLGSEVDQCWSISPPHRCHRQWAILAELPW